MKKKFFAVTIFALFTLLNTAFAADDTSVNLNGKTLVFDVPPKVIDGRTMVPLRTIFESLGAEVEWNDKTQTVTAKRGDTSVQLTIGKPEIIVNNTAKVLDVSPCTIDGRTLVPVRAISESFKLNVSWSDKEQTVYIYPKNFDPAKYQALKNAIVDNGTKTFDSSYVMVCVPIGENYKCTFTYDFDRNEILIFVNWNTIQKNETLISIRYNENPDILHLYNKYNVYCEFPKDTGEFIKYESNVPSDMQPEAYSALDENVKIAELLLQHYSSVTLEDIGIK